MYDGDPDITSNSGHGLRSHGTRGRDGGLLVIDTVSIKAGAEAGDVAASFNSDRQDIVNNVALVKCNVLVWSVAPGVVNDD